MAYQSSGLAFTPRVRAIQEKRGSRADHAEMERSADRGEAFTRAETAFIQARDSFYVASVSETGWPHLQHR
ncbi:MAG: hypothetical protein AAFQ42_06045 [Pseudomonadota bacterium]